MKQLLSAEVGRQPWIVYGLMKTKEAVSPIARPGQIWASLTMFAFMYGLLLLLFLYLLDHKIRHGPDEQAYDASGQDGFPLVQGDRAAI